MDARYTRLDDADARPDTFRNVFGQKGAGPEPSVPGGKAARNPSTRTTAIFRRPYGRHE